MSDKKIDWQTIAYQAVEALRLTREYVEPKVSLPEIEGWSWYDATLAYRRALDAACGDDEEMFVDARILDCRDAAKPILSVVTCNMCGSLVVDTDKHFEFHHKHGHDGFGFMSEY